MNNRIVLDEPGVDEHEIIVAKTSMSANIQKREDHIQDDLNNQGELEVHLRRGKAQGHIQVKLERRKYAWEFAMDVFMN